LVLRVVPINLKPPEGSFIDGPLQTEIIQFSEHLRINLTK